jgi:hypothetical protein
MRSRSSEDSLARREAICLAHLQLLPANCQERFCDRNACTDSRHEEQAQRGDFGQRWPLAGRQERAILNRHQ